MNISSLVWAGTYHTQSSRGFSSPSVGSSALWLWSRDLHSPTHSLQQYTTVNTIMNRPAGAAELWWYYTIIPVKHRWEGIRRMQIVNRMFLRLSYDWFTAPASVSDVSHSIYDLWFFSAVFPVALSSRPSGNRHPIGLQSAGFDPCVTSSVCLSLDLSVSDVFLCSRSSLCCNGTDGWSFSFCNAAFICSWLLNLWHLYYCELWPCVLRLFS